METIKCRSVDFTKSSYDYYSKRCKVKVFYEKDADGNKYPALLRIYEVQRIDWGMKNHVAFIGNEGKNFNPVLDWNESEKMNKLGPANQ